ncbi:unnamed protein product [Heligmosomoides polygyrus]|uniref:Autophagy-related protein 101 n=2 Tax=Heligmosomoides polygyrus TaxID=6339 RepID=A0A183GE05_HELPZ|nr:unnamed protein product [Heligmosomoides polygyrus]
MFSSDLTSGTGYGRGLFGVLITNLTFVFEISTNYGRLQQVGFVHTEELPKSGEWSGNVCMNLLSNVLTSLRDLLDVDGEACIVRFEQNRREITIHSAPLPDVDFFTYSFRVHFNLE